ncbi:MAG TPA: 5'/3'-nucleotidase SurE [Mycobacteriales bacterium]|nr:5'/3'-nucleotidase SurE [Mycobacteriales bacterium]
MSSAARVLVTNDDGITSEGLRRLAAVANDAGLDVVVAAPATNASGASASLTAVQSGGRIRTDRHALAQLEGLPAFGVEATPAFIALIAMRGAFGPPPDIVLSGINSGHNAGQAVLHSGTVGAALTGASHGCRAMAVSLIAGRTPHWDTAAAVATQVLPPLLDAAPGTVVNVNAPDVPVAEIRGVRQARLASFGAVQTNIAEIGQGFVRLEVVDIDAELEAGTDAALLGDGWATLTALLPICESDARGFACLFEDSGTSPSCAHIVNHKIPR